MRRWLVQSPYVASATYVLSKLGSLVRRIADADLSSTMPARGPAQAACAAAKLAAGDAFTTSACVHTCLESSENPNGFTPSYHCVVGSASRTLPRSALATALILS